MTLTAYKDERVSLLQRLCVRIHPLAVCLAVLSLLWTTGCQPTTNSGDSAAPTSAPTSLRSESAESSDTIQPGEASEEAAQDTDQQWWEVVLMEGTKVGHAHWRIRQIERGGESLMELSNEFELTTVRFGQTVSQRIETQSIETSGGEVLRFTTKMLTPGSTLTIEGRYQDGQMLIETTTRGKTDSSAIEWDPEWGGLFADQQSLRQSPMQPGETRELTALVPGTAQAGLIRLQATNWQPTNMQDGERELLRIESSVLVAGTTIKSIVWTDEQGKVLKMEVPAQGLEQYRTTKEVALAPSQARPFDLGQRTVVKVAQQLPSPHQTRQVVYRARLRDGNPAEVFASGGTQTVHRIDAHTADIIVRAVRPGDNAVPVSAPAGQRPTDADSQPNNLIQSDDALVIKLANQIVADERDAAKIAVALESHVHDLVRVNDFSQAIASAADVARKREGDCTEHAVLLAAFARARGIPARVAIGLVYFGRAEGFAYHMWNEVWIQGRWVPLDATLARGGVGAAHIKVTDSDLSNASPVSALLPVVQLIGQLELEIISAN